MKTANVLILLLLALFAAPAFAQDEEGGEAPLPPASPAAEPMDPNAPLIVGKEEPLPGPAEQTQPKCECCGHYWAQSPTRVEAVVKRNGGEKETAFYESIAC